MNYKKEKNKHFINNSKKKFYYRVKNNGNQHLIEQNEEQKKLEITEKPLMEYKTIEKNSLEQNNKNGLQLIEKHKNYIEKKYNLENQIIKKKKHINFNYEKNIDIIDNKLKNFKIQLHSNLSANIIEKLNNNTYECIICNDIIKKQVLIWSCSNCFMIFHLFCIKKWKNSNAGNFF